MLEYCQFIQFLGFDVQLPICIRSQVKPQRYCIFVFPIFVDNTAQIERFWRNPEIHYGILNVSHLDLPWYKVKYLFFIQIQEKTPKKSLNHKIYFFIFLAVFAWKYKFL